MPSTGDRHETVVMEQPLSGRVEIADGEHDVIDNERHLEGLSTSSGTAAELLVE
jgi:hypothetical protein